MPYTQTTRSLGQLVPALFGTFEGWLDHPIVVGRFRPPSGGWSADQILDHVTLTNHFLLLTLAKKVEQAERRAGRGGLAEGGWPRSRKTPRATWSGCQSSQIG